MYKTGSRWRLPLFIVFMWCCVMVPVLIWIKDLTVVRNDLRDFKWVILSTNYKEEDLFHCTLAILTHFFYHKFENFKDIIISTQFSKIFNARNVWIENFTLHIHLFNYKNDFRTYDSIVAKNTSTIRPLLRISIFINVKYPKHNLR